ncbi:MAG: hypothetical protein HUU01_02610 [Saprospiraceae bacterium]|nr:hypothetical protein [Saprospiraceae bacterium]
MKKQDDLKKELEELSPLLSKLKAQDNPFKAPEGYFSSLPDELMARLRHAEQPLPAPVQSGWSTRLLEFLESLIQPRLVVGFATIALLIVAGVLWLRQESGNEVSEQLALFSDLSAEEVNAYVTENIDAFEEEELMVAVEESGIEVENSLPAIDLDAQAIEEYMEDAIHEMDEEDLESLF